MTVYLKPKRNRYFHDKDGVLSTAKREDEIVPLIINWSDLIGSATISDVSYDDSGVTRSSTSNTTTTTTTYVTDIGETEITVTLSTGEKVQMLVRFYEEETHDGIRESDYE
jgi:hypothetical protein